MTAFELNCFGGFRLTAHGRNVVLPTAKARTMFAFLALRERRPVPRDTLMELFWGTRSERQARASLAGALSSIRKHVGVDGDSLLTSTRYTVGLDHARLECDVLRFESLLRGRRPERLRDAVILSTPKFLDGIATRDSAADDWITQEQQRLQNLREEALCALLQTSSATLSERKGYAESLLLLNPYQETAHRWLMRFHAEEGDRARAIQQYQSLVVLLEQELNYILEGGLRKEGNHIRVNAALIEASSGYLRWSGHYDQSLDDLFAAQDQITRNITLEMRVQLREGEQAHVWTNRSRSFEAWEYFVQGLNAMQRMIPEENIKARELANRALNIDPKYVDAINVLGWTHWFDAMFGWSSSQSQSRKLMFEAARRAVDIDPNHPEGLTFSASCHALVGDNEHALLQGKKALDMAPNHAYNTLGYAWCLRSAGEYEEAIRWAKRAMRLSPHHPVAFPSVLGSCYHLLGDNESALPILRNALRITSDSLDPNLWLTSVLVETKDLAQASSYADVIRVGNPRLSADAWAKASVPEPQASRLRENLVAVGIPA